MAQNPRDVKERDNHLGSVKARGFILGAWGLWTLCIGLVATGTFFYVASRAVPQVAEWGFRGFPAIIALPFATVGAILASRRPTNPIGWIFCVLGVTSGIQMAVEEYSVYTSVGAAGQTSSDVAAWIGEWIWVPSVGLASIAVQLFPTGRLVSSRWRPALWLTEIGIAIAISGMLFAPPEVGAGATRNPFEIQGLAPLFEAAVYLGLALLLLSLILGAGSVIVRMKGSRGDERQQFKWLVFGAALLPVGNVVAGLPLPSIVQDLGACGAAAFPVATGIAILKHRLYDLDVVINRTLVYGVITAILALTYLGIVVVLQGVLAGVTEDSDLAIAGSTLAVAALFGPLRTRIQILIDHRFYRSKYDAASTLRGFSARLRDQVDLDSLTRELADVVGTTMQPEHVSVWLRPRVQP